MSYLVCYCPTIYTHFPCYRAISSAFLVPVLTVFIHRWRYVHQFWGRTDGFRLYSHMQTGFGTLLKSHKHIAYACVICYWWLTFCTTFSCHCHMLCELQVFHVNRRKCTWKVIQVMDTMVLSHIRDFKSWFVGKIFEKRPIFGVLIGPTLGVPKWTIRHQPGLKGIFAFIPVTITRNWLLNLNTTHHGTKHLTGNYVFTFNSIIDIVRSYHNKIRNIFFSYFCSCVRLRKHRCPISKGALTKISPI